MFSITIRLIIISLFLFTLFLSIYAFDRESGIPLGTKRSIREVATKKLGTDKPQSAEINFLLFNNEDKQLQILTDGDKVASGEQFRINVKTGKKAYLYIFNIDSSNHLYTLFPNKELALSNPLQGDVDYSIPSEDEGLMFTFDDNHGIERFYIFISSTPMITLENLMNKVPLNGVKIDRQSPLKQQLEHARPNEGEDGVIIAKLKEKKDIKNIKGKTFKINPYMILFKKNYAKKFIIFHKNSRNEDVTQKDEKEGEKEQWLDENLAESSIDE